MNSFKIGKEYIIYFRDNDRTKKPAPVKEWKIKILSFCESDSSKIYVKFLSGDRNIMGKEKFITSKYYDFEEYEDFTQDTPSIEENLENVKRELNSIREMSDEIRENKEKYEKFLVEMKEKIKYYKEMEMEAIAARCFFVGIIWLYIMGYIRFTYKFFS